MWKWPDALNLQIDKMTLPPFAFFFLFKNQMTLFLWEKKCEKLYKKSVDSKVRATRKMGNMQI